MVIELLQSDMPEKEYTRHNEVDEWAVKLKVGKPRFAPRPAVAPDLFACGHRGQSGCLHPMHALRARLPR